MSQDYKDTLNLPKTDFAMKANLPTRESEILKRWEKEDIYAAIRKKSKDQDRYILHDGPAYANGDVHIGTALNRILKDIVVRYKTMRGYDAPFVPGWDCHGQPIEYQFLKSSGIKVNEIEPGELRKRCRDFALNFVDIQREEFKRLGIFGDWEHPYLTLDGEFEAKEIEVVGRLIMDGYVYKGLKPVHWCPRCETALAEAEVEYEELTSPSIYVRFPIKDAASGAVSSARNAKNIKKNIYFLVWTTTPWTLPANVAVALHPDFDYGFYEFEDEVLLVAKGLMEKLPHFLEKSPQLLRKIKGKELLDLKLLHPFIDRESLVIAADYVTLEEGTGCVHTAPGHGLDDYLSGLRYNLPILAPVDSKGRFTKEFPLLKGKDVFGADKDIIEILDKKRLLFHRLDITHSYPHCWRCKSPIIFRATEQWFISMDKHNLRKRAVAGIGEVKWIPSWGRERIEGMVSQRPDWCISRQRKWGVPIPVFYCRGCKKPVVTEETISHLSALVLKEGTDIWFEKSPEKLLPPSFGCPHCGGRKFDKEEDILDVWFDSGITHIAVLKGRKELAYPAELYLEGSDQHRGWFQSSLLTAVCISGDTPYKSVLTHGLVLADDGKKMSKSLGNLVTSGEAVERYGADILRLWVASEDYQENMHFSEEILTRVCEAYRKVRNTYKFILGNLYDFHPEEDGLSYDKLLEEDRWALQAAGELISQATPAYEEFSFHRAYQLIYEFCIVILSSFYLDVLKDRLYTLTPDSLERRSAQTTLYKIAKVIMKLMAPIMPFTTEEAWGYLSKGSGEPKSIHLASWPETPAEWQDARLQERWKRLFTIREKVLKEIEEMRQAGLVGSSLEVEAIFYTGEGGLSEEETHLLQDLIATVLIVSFVRIEKVSKKDFKEMEGPIFNLTTAKGHPWGIPNTSRQIDVRFKISKARGEKCSRCWRYSESIGEDKDYPGLCKRCSRVMKETR